MRLSLGMGKAVFFGALDSGIRWNDEDGDYSLERRDARFPRPGFVFWCRYDSPGAEPKHIFQLPVYTPSMISMNRLAWGERKRPLRSTRP